MIGIFPSSNKTFEIYGDFNSKELIEGKLYYDPSNGQLYYYSKIETRSNPNTGFFPIWNGTEKFISLFSNEKYFDKDAINISINSMCSNINKDIANQILYNQRRSDNNNILQPKISDDDNMFTQCVKGIINALQVTMIDLVDMSSPKLSQKQIENYYAALIKIAFMRIDKWDIWTNVILHVGYEINVFKGDKKILSYNYPKNIFDTGDVVFDKIINSNDDPYKKIVKLLMTMENIQKNDLKSDEVDDYTINNMITMLNGSKALSAQLFSRFIRMAGFSYQVLIFKDGKQIFEFKE